MSPNQLNNKIDELDFWLENNPDHEHYTLKFNERNTLLEQLLNTDY
ncbi:hypothetical protein [Pseudotamlana carrageenivorans]|nr:hypothetical protein [Tamlana carrageenivorans]